MKTKKIFLFIPLFIIMLFSLYAMYSVKSINTLYNNYFYKQLLWYILGFLVMFIFSHFSLNIKSKIPLILYIINVLLLFLVLLIGDDVNGAKAWFNLKYFSFQPSELMKFTLCLYLSFVIAKHNSKKIKKEIILITKVIIIILIPSILVFLEPDTGAIILYMLIGFTMLLTAKLNKWWYISLILILTLFGGIFFFLYFKEQDLLIKLIGSSFFYRVDRLINFTHGTGFQIKTALIAIGSSSFFRFKLNGPIYIPEAPTDFIVAYLISVTGLFGFIIIALAYLIIDIYFLNLLFKEKNKQNKLFIAGFIGMFFFQQLQNFSMNVGLLPIMGIPLPFLSYGGTNILVYFIFLSMIFKKNKRKIN